MGQTVRTAACLLLLSTMVAPAQTTVLAQSDVDQAHMQWLSTSLAGIQAMKVGMTRKDLLTLFQEDGGLQLMRGERYVYKGCPLIKVDVTFVADNETDHSKDKIKSISKPYLEDPFYD